MMLNLLNLTKSCLVVNSVFDYKIIYQIYQQGLLFLLFFLMQIGKNISQIYKNNHQSPQARKQNYVPFISKSPRFKNNFQKDQQNKQTLISKDQKQIIHRFPSLYRQKSKQKQQNCIFKSNQQRFKESVFKTPSPDHYNIQQRQQHRDRPSGKKVHVVDSCRKEPSIPDNRNKFGYHLENKQLKILEKSRVDLEKQKLLMRKYQESMLIEKKYKLYTQPEASKINQKQMTKQIKNILKDDPMFKGQFQKILKNKENDDSRSLAKLKPKYTHLYQFKPKPQKDLKFLYQRQQQRSSDKHKETRFQFFNSSQKRFKTQCFDNMHKSRKMLRQQIGKRNNMQKC